MRCIIILPKVRWKEKGECTRMDRRWVVAGAVSALLSVAIGAFGAHALDLPADRAATYDTAVQYHMFHAVGMIAAGFLRAWRGSSRRTSWAAGLFLAGTFLFSGSLYVYAIADMSWLGAIAPLGGASFLAGWALFAAAAWSDRSAK